MVTSASPRPARRRPGGRGSRPPGVGGHGRATVRGRRRSTPRATTASPVRVEAITLGYSAWPGWFPWAVAEEAGIFEEVGVDVELKWFDDYLGSLDAMAAGQVDANSQTLNDTLVGVSAGGDQVVVLVNDNSAGNDAIIVDESITSIEDLAGQDIAAEAGVVDHFLLLQGLDSVGLTEDDIDFQGLLTADAAAAFSGGEFDAVGVFAPFTLQALERAGSKVLFDSADFPGTIPDFLAVDRQLVEERPEDVQLLVDAWYATLDYIEENPDEATEIMAERPGCRAEEYAAFAGGTKLFTAEEALASLDRRREHRPRPMAERGGAFLVDTGLVEEQPSSTACSTRPSPRTTWNARAVTDPPGADVGVTARRPAPPTARCVRRRPASGAARPRRRAGGPGRCRGGRCGALRGIRGPLPLRRRLGLGVGRGRRPGRPVGRGRPADRPGPDRRPGATLGATWAALARCGHGTLSADLAASASACCTATAISVAIGIVVGVAIGALPGGRGRRSRRRSGSCATSPPAALTPLMLLWLGIDEAPEDHADRAGHGVLQHPDGRGRGPVGAT